MNKNIAEPGEESTSQNKEAILAKYKKKARDIAEEKKKNKEDSEKRAAKERQRLMGRRIPTADTAEKERSL